MTPFFMYDHLSIKKTWEKQKDNEDLQVCNLLTYAWDASFVSSILESLCLDYDHSYSRLNGAMYSTKQNICCLYILMKKLQCNTQTWVHLPMQVTSSVGYYFTLHTLDYPLPYLDIGNFELSLKHYYPMWAPPEYLCIS
jgi:hypothetical protein